VGWSLTEGEGVDLAKLDEIAKTRGLIVLLTLQAAADYQRRVTEATSEFPLRLCWLVWRDFDVVCEKEGNRCRVIGGDASEHRHYGDRWFLVEVEVHPQRRA
jgi:hypothetical protein